MADPVTLGLGATIAGGGVSAFGQFMGGQSQSAMYKYQASTALVNQQIDKQNADYEREVGGIEAEKSGMKTAETISNTKSIQSASGIDIGSGSGKGVRESEGALGQFDQAIIRSNYAKKAYGYDVKAYEEGVQANVYKMSADKSATAGLIGSLGTILGTAGSVSSKWLQGQSAGLWGDSGSGKIGYFDDGGGSAPNWR